MALGLLHGRQLAFCAQFDRRYAVRTGLTELPFSLVSSGAELFHRPAHTSGEFGQFFRTEQEEDNEEDYHQVRPHKVHDTGDRNRHKKSRMCLFRKKVVLRSIHSYRIRKVIFQESDFPHGMHRRSLEGVRSTKPF